MAAPCPDILPFVKPAPGEWDDLRLAAKAADRAATAKALWPAFERRLKELGYAPRAIAHAFSALTRAGTVHDALAALVRYEALERVTAVPLRFETVEESSGLPPGHSLTITGVQSDGHGVRVSYIVRPALALDARPPDGEARDDRNHTYSDLGGALGLTELRDCSTGVLTMPFPDPSTSRLRVRMSWSQDSGSLWTRPAHEITITLEALA